MTAFGSSESPTINKSEVYLNGATIMTTPTSQQIQISRIAGYKGIEVRAERLLAAPHELKAAAAMVGQGEVWSLNGIQLQLDKDFCLDLARLEADLSPRLEICKVLGAAYLLVVPPRTYVPDAKLTIAAMRDGLTIAQERAAKIAVKVGFEFLGFNDCPINTLALAAEVIASLPGVDLVIDSCHWHASGSEEMGKLLVDRLAMIHLNDAPQKELRKLEDSDRLLPARGVIRLTDLIRSVLAHGYRGPWSLETFNPNYWTADPLSIATEGRALIETLLDATNS